jgi:hypothetical protein
LPNAQYSIRYVSDLYQIYERAFTDPARLYVVDVPDPGRASFWVRKYASLGRHLDNPSTPPYQYGMVVSTYNFFHLNACGYKTRGYRGHCAFGVGPDECDRDMILGACPFVRVAEPGDIRRLWTGAVAPDYRERYINFWLEEHSKKPTHVVVVKRARGMWLHNVFLSHEGDIVNVWRNYEGA